MEGCFSIISYINNFVIVTDKNACDCNEYIKVIKTLPIINKYICNVIILDILST